MGRPKAALLAITVLVAAGAVVAALNRGPAATGSGTSSGAVAPEGTTGGTPGVSSSLGALPERTADVGPALQSPEGSEGSGGTSASDAKGGLAAAPAALGQPVTLIGPRVVRTAEVAVRVATGGFSRAFDQITAVAVAEGGYVSGSTTSTTSTGHGDDRREERARSGDLTVRMPADRFDAVRRTLAGLGTIEQEQIRGEDVTAQIVDFDARLKSLQAEEDALRTLVGRATAVGEVLQVQSQLFQVRQQVESLQAQRTQLDQQASLATIHVSLMEPGAAVEPSPEPAGLAHALDQAVAGSTAVVGGTIVVLGWLAPVALVALLAWGVVRLRRRGATRVAPNASAI